MSRKEKQEDISEKFHCRKWILINEEACCLTTAECLIKVILNLTLNTILWHNTTGDTIISLCGQSLLSYPCDCQVSYT